MIVEWLMSIGGGFAEWLASIVPAIPNDFLAGMVGTAAVLGGFAGSLSVWVNWVLVGWLVVQVMTMYFVLFAVRIVRAVVGHIPLIGGNG